MSLDATRELAHRLGVEPLALLQANRDRPWTWEGGSLAFASLREGDVLRHPHGGEVEIVRMGAAQLRLGDSSIVQSYQAQLQTRISGLGTQAQTTLQQQTGVNVTQPRVAAGAAAAVSLASNGFNPNDAADRQKLVAAIAGGLCLIPAVGPALGAAVEALYQVANAISCPTMKLAADLGLGDLPPECGGSPCTSTGNWTTAGILSSNAGSLPAQPSGSFAQFACAALAEYAAQAANCKASLPPGLIVDACVNIWNQTHAGPSTPYLVPPLFMVNKGITAFGPPTIVNVWQNVSGTGSAPSLRANKDPYAYYAFGALSAIPSSEHPNLNASPAGQLWAVAPSAVYNVDPPRFVMVNTGAATSASSAQTPQPTAGWPGLPPLATRFETGKTYLTSSIVQGADAKTGQPAVAGTPVMTEDIFLKWMPLAGFVPAQLLWWGPTSTTDDPAGYLTKGWLGAIFSLGQQLHAMGGVVLLLGTYTGAGEDVGTGVYAYDVSGSMTPRQTVLATGLSTGAKAGIAVAGTAAAAGGLWLVLGKPLTIQAAQAALSALFGRL